MIDPPRLLVLLGSGETAPAMRALHAALLARAEPGRPRLLLETTYGFQANEAEMTARLLEWFAVNVGSPIEPAGLPRLDGPDLLARERGLARVAEAGYLLAGPGSPSFACRQWFGTPIPGRMREMLATGGIVVLASAAALTAGARTLPVYEIYKAGEDPAWLPGLDLLAPWGIDAAIVPHYDNAEGGGHDTRCCFVGESRMALLETMLPESAWILGIDEHTALAIDLAAGTATISGKGGVTLRGRGGASRIEAGATVPLAELRPPGASAPRTPVPATPHEPATGPASAAGAGGRAGLAAFREALAAGETARAGEIALAAANAAGSRRDAGDPGDPALAAMIVALADVAAAPPPVDPRAVAEPFARALLDVRAAVRAEKRWDLSDLIRDRMAEAGVTVRDTPDGPVWDFS
ncbi:MAG: hypothetical protein ACKOWF_07220 [Chloroflexota bacterium]